MGLDFSKSFSLLFVGTGFLICIVIVPAGNLTLVGILLEDFVIIQKVFIVLLDHSGETRERKQSPRTRVTFLESHLAAGEVTGCLILLLRTFGEPAQ